MGSKTKSWSLFALVLWNRQIKKKPQQRRCYPEFEKRTKDYLVSVIFFIIVSLIKKKNSLNINIQLTSMISTTKHWWCFEFQNKTFCNITCTFSSCFINICYKHQRWNIILYVFTFIDMFLIACAFASLSFTQGIRKFCKMNSGIGHFSINDRKSRRKVNHLLLNTINTTVLANSNDINYLFHIGDIKDYIFWIN